MENTNYSYPLILVFYLDRSVFETPEILTDVVQSVENRLKKDNIISFFLRCAEGEKERIEAINPILAGEDKMNEINKLVDDIKKQFDIGQGADKNINDPNDFKILL